MISVSYAVQHHPSRAALIPPLLERLGEAMLVTDPDPGGVASPMRCYRACLELTPPEATHRLILQDDAWPCANFRERAEAAISERPDKIIAFFVPGVKAAGSRRVMGASRRKEAWAQIGGAMIVPLVATSWPTSLIEPFLDFSRQPHWREKLADDAVAAAFVKRNRYEVWATVPSLVEHLDVADSLVGKIARAGANRARVAALFSE